MTIYEHGFLYRYYSGEGKSRTLKSASVGGIVGLYNHSRYGIVITRLVSTLYTWYNIALQSLKLNGTSNPTVSSGG